jgi:uncharacterized membrane protein YdjX (TVP38/TMEM64 family)
MLKKPLIKVLLIICVLGTLFFVFKQLNIDFSKISIDQFKETIHVMGIWGPVAYIVFYILRPLILFPAALLSASAGAIWGLQGMIYLLIAANLSAVSEFFIARYFAREAVEKLVKGRLSQIDSALEKNGFVTVLLIRLIPNVAWDIQNLGLGLTKVKFRDYFVATFLGIIPGCFVLIYFGSSLISVLVDPKNFWKIFVAFGLLFGVYYLQKYLRDKQSTIKKS